MQKNDKFYTFLLSKNTTKGIYLRRFSIPKRHLHFGTISGFFLITLSILGIGVSSSLETGVFAREAAKPAVELVSADTRETAKIDYSRPSSEVYTANSGGPEFGGGATDDPQMEAQIRLLKATMVPGNVPNAWAHLGKINNEFGFRRNPFGGRAYEFHGGMDIDGERGQPVTAPGGGVVTMAEYRGGYGNMVEIDHGSGLTTRYGHLSKIDVQVGDQIGRGHVVGSVGSTGRSTGPHLHFEFRLNDRAINPRHFLPQEPTNLAAIIR